jgi:phosphate:Na+ symporter
MYDDTVEQFFRFDARRTLRIRSKEQALDVLQRDISAFLVRLSRQSISTEIAMQIPSMLTYVNTVEHAGDQSEKIIDCLLRKKENKVVFSAAAMSELKSLAVRVGDLVHLALVPLDELPATAVAEARLLKDEVESIQEKMFDNHMKRLAEGNCTALAGVVYNDLIAAFVKMAEYSYTIIKLEKAQRNA